MENCKITSKTYILCLFWVDFQFIPEVEKNTTFGDDGFKCGLKEVRFGDIRIKSIRLNINNVPHNQQIAYIPTGFITNANDCEQGCKEMFGRVQACTSSIWQSTGSTAIS